MKIYVGGAIGRYVEPDHHISILSLLPTIYQRTGHAAIYKPSVNDAMLDRARGTCATRFLEKSDADVLLSLDSDVVFQAEDAIRVCEAAMEHGIVGAIYVTRGKGKNCYPSSLPVDGQRVYFGNDTTPVEYRYVATGFVAVHRRVFEALAKRDDCPILHASSDLYRFRPFYTPFWYDFLGLGEQMYLSEDWAFCDRAAQEGFKSYIDPSVRVQHLGLWPFKLEDMLREDLATQPLWLTRESSGLYVRDAVAEPELLVTGAR